jgi:RimJ/RimL family protein N-acetyltransferase
MGLVDRWPLFGLRVRTPRLELRYPDDTLALALAELALGGVHDPGEMPFMTPWTDAPPDELPRNSLQWQWRSRAEHTVDKWRLDLAVIVDGEVVGAQGVAAEQFARRRGVLTGSWLGRAHQGQGIGTEMRRAMLHLAFAGLGAEFAETEAFEDNPSSLGVTRKLGYEPCGDAIHVRRDAPARTLHFRMARAWWEEHLASDDVAIDGLEPCLPLLIAAPA